MDVRGGFSRESADMKGGARERLKSFEDESWVASVPRGSSNESLGGAPVLAATWSKQALWTAGADQVHRLFENQASHRPSAIALADQEEEISYADLEYHTDRLAS